MTISNIVNAAAMLAGLERSRNSIPAQPVPIYDLILVLIAIGVWVFAIACIAAWLRARERAHEHIGWIRINPRRARSFNAPGPYRPQASRKPDHSWKPMEQN